MHVNSPSKNRRRGFSLVEVAIAVGITAVGVVALMGLLSTGLGAMREAANTAAEARISQFLVGQVQLTDWARLSATYPSDSQRLYKFDDQAIKLPDSSLANASYTARVVLPVPDVIIPGATAADPNLRRVLVDVTSVPNVDSTAWFDETANRGRFRTYASTVTNMGNSAQ